MTAAVTPGRDELARIIKAAMTGAHTGKIIPAEEIGFAEIYDRNFLVAADAVLARLAAKPAEEGVSCILQNQIEIMGAVSLLLRYTKPDLVGKAGELDQQRDDLIRRHKATQAALSTTGEPKR